MKEETRQALNEHAIRYATEDLSETKTQVIQEEVDALIHGAEWYRNNVWHDASEDVGTNEPILVLDEEGRGVTTDRERLIRGWGEWGKGFCRWAYVEDLLPDNCINKDKES